MNFCVENSNCFCYLFCVVFEFFFLPIKSPPFLHTPLFYYFFFSLSLSLSVNWPTATNQHQTITDLALSMQESLEAQRQLWAQKIPKGFDNFFPKGGGGGGGDSPSKDGEVREEGLRAVGGGCNTMELRARAAFAASCVVSVCIMTRGQVLLYHTMQKSGKRIDTAKYSIGWFLVGGGGWWR